MTNLWRKYLIQAAKDFDRGLESFAMEKLQEFKKHLDGLEPEEMLNALGSAANLLEDKGDVTDAIAMCEELIEFAIAHDPLGLLTARDWSRLADLFAKTGQTRQELQALESAEEIYKRLNEDDKKQLEEHELGGVYMQLAQTRAAVESQDKLRHSLATRSDCLLRMAEIMRSQSRELAEYPEQTVQQLYNGLSPFAGLTPVAAITERLRNHQTVKQRTWCELVNVSGPGKDGWMQRQSVRRTLFPEEIEHLVSLTDGRLLAVGRSGSLWVTQPGGQARSIQCSCRPRSGEGSLAHIGDDIALVDTQGTLRFLRAREYVLEEIATAHADAALVGQSASRFVAAFHDGRVVRFDRYGCEQISIANASMPQATLLFAWKNDSRVMLVENHKSEGGLQASVRFIDFDPLTVHPVIDLPVGVQSVNHCWHKDLLLVGGMSDLLHVESRAPDSREIYKGLCELDHTIRRW